MFESEQLFETEQQHMSVLEKASKMSVSSNSSYRQAYSPARSVRPVASGRSTRQVVPAKGINYARRRVMAVVLLVVALLAIAFSMLQTQSAGASSHSVKANFTYVYVAPGDTLWSIATKYAPERDPQQEITDIQNLNALSSSEVVPGQRLALP